MTGILLLLLCASGPPIPFSELPIPPSIKAHSAVQCFALWLHFIGPKPSW